MAKLKLGEVKYEVYNIKDKKIVRCLIKTKQNNYLSAADLEAILKVEFPGVPRKKITFSPDGDYLLFGDDSLPKENCPCCGKNCSTSQKKGK